MTAGEWALWVMAGASVVLALVAIVAVRVLLSAGGGDET